MRLEHLENANRQIADSERIIAGWQALVHTMRAEGRDVTVACNLLETFKRNLEAQRSRRDLIQQALAERALPSQRPRQQGDPNDSPNGVMSL
jgi:hypothetical protein